MPLWFSNLVSWSAQVALIVLIAGLLLRLFPIRHPHARLALLRGFLLLTLLLPILQPWHRLPSVTTRPDLSGAVIVNSTPPPAAAHWRLPDMPTLADGIGVVLVCGIALRFALLALGLLKLRRLRTASVPITMGEPLAEILSQILAKVGVRAEFRISTNVDSPVTFGLTNPVVLLPERFLATEARLQSVIACHELLHARRRDWAQHLIEEIVRAIFGSIRPSRGSSRAFGLQESNSSTSKLCTSRASARRICRRCLNSHSGVHGPRPFLRHRF